MSRQGVRTGWRRKSMIWTTYPDRICYHPDGVDPNSLAHSVSSGRGVPTPCTRRRSPLRSIAYSTRGGIPSTDISHPNVSQSDGMAASTGWNSYQGGMSYDSLLGGMSRIPYSLYYGVAYGKGLQSFSSSCF